MQYTSINQSKRLIELGLDLNTADLYFDGFRNLYLGTSTMSDTIPAWSLEALLRVIPCPYQMSRGRNGRVQLFLMPGLRFDDFPYELDAVYMTVVWLLENDLFDPIKLKNYGSSKRAD